ncbi:MAG: redox-sensing transcriptional repressor Rex [Lachnospiraceae bacterium]|nr:redox-sensing transcriptional repressor Rex [Lachnospiraceae bacterium]
MKEKYISMAVIRRLPTYYRYLGNLEDAGVERVSSQELSDALQMTASQIRQDLNNFGGFGQQGYGYNVAKLHTEIGKILGVDTPHHMIIIGAGNLGQALAGYSSFGKRNFDVSAIFDVREEVIGKEIRGVTIQPMDSLEAYLKDHVVDVAALTVPKSAAVEIAHNLKDWGAKSIWNFAPIDLELPKDYIVENVWLLDSLMRLSYSLKEKEEA